MRTISTSCLGSQKNSRVRHSSRVFEPPTPWLRRSKFSVRSMESRGIVTRQEVRFSVERPLVAPGDAHLTTARVKTNIHKQNPTCYASRGGNWRSVAATCSCLVPRAQRDRVMHRRELPCRFMPDSGRARSLWRARVTTEHRNPFLTFYIIHPPHGSEVKSSYAKHLHRQQQPHPTK